MNMTEHSDSAVQTGLHDLLNEAAEDFFPGNAPYDAIVGKGRRRAGLRVAGGSALSMVAIGAAVAVGTGTFAGPQGSSPATSAAGQPAAAPTVSGEDMVKWLEQGLAPYGITSKEVTAKGGTNTPFDTPGSPIASANHGAGAYARLKIGYGGSVGSALVEVTHSPCATSGVTGSVPHVAVTDLPDGSHLVVGDLAQASDPNLKLLDVAWYRTDGTKISILEDNVVSDKNVVSGSQLALTQDQVTKLVQSPIWDKAIASELAG